MCDLGITRHYHVIHILYISLPHCIILPNTFIFDIPRSSFFPFPSFYLSSTCIAEGAASLRAKSFTLLFLVETDSKLMLV